MSDSYEPSRVTATKLDGCEPVTPLLGMVRELRQPVSYLKTGQRIPEDVWRASPASLAPALVREAAMEEYSCR